MPSHFSHYHLLFLQSQTGASSIPESFLPFSSGDFSTIILPLWWNKYTRSKNVQNNRIRACAGELSGPVKLANPNQLYHPSEDISDCEESDENGDAILRPAETSRTIIEANSNALLMFSGLVNDRVYENIFLPELPYVKGENGNIYFQVKNDEDILQTLASGDNVVLCNIVNSLSKFVSVLLDRI